MDYNETIKFLFESLPMFQRVGNAAYKANLDNTLALDNYLKNPHKQFKSIHIAGTNGKGSTSHMIASVLQQSGYKVGLYTSPHLKDFRERIKINGLEISKDYIVDFVNENMSFFDKIKPSFFEMTVALAFSYFADNKIDIAVVETGMGGRLDSTNIIKPELSVITNISKDHTQFLGDTIEKIAIEKAGIIKEKTSVVIGETNIESKNVFVEKSKENNADIFFADQLFKIDYSMNTIDEKQSFNVYKSNKLVLENLKIDLLGNYQKHNLKTALSCIDILNKKGYNLSKQNIYSGFENIKLNTGLNGRWQILGRNPRIVGDTGHNEAGIREVVEQIKKTPYKELHMIIGVVNDKNIENILSLLPKEAVYYFTKANIPRALDEKILMNEASNFNLFGESYSKVSDALKSAKKNAGENDFIFVGGSTFVVAEVV
ncbi:MAG: bifunctional folylpolyglutamate synthase/dihydrofolate synthase [Bacteroidales bacterium]|nr:bifunctional folylpolyglutamate synthase/dihydrofolate synthase [Bacteroidales bacterium]MBN2757175.1 bifunctional folylpolyglutamate synthase/dihydrofolate synthase [Bacteroidales bacterium]